jgi:hypothetical protein
MLRRTKVFAQRAEGIEDEKTFFVFAVGDTVCGRELPSSDADGI